MIDQITHGLDVLNLAGQISLKELAALVQLSETLICVDSLPFHLASALKKPVVAFFGPTSDVTWGPWRNPHARIVSQPFSCRPCYQDGCGGSKVSDCLATLPIAAVLHTLNNYPLRLCGSAPLR
jgi:heptosyltransferase-3